MTEILQKIRDAISGKKTIITAVIGILTAALAWAGGELTDWQALAAAWVAIQIIFIRSGQKKDAETMKAAEIVMDNYERTDLFLTGFDRGQTDGARIGYLKGWSEGEDFGRYEDE